MTADNPQDHPYQVRSLPNDKQTRLGYWRVASGLQAVDGLKTSGYFDLVAEEHSCGRCKTEDAGKALSSHYNEEARSKISDGSNDDSELARECKEADLVGFRIVELLEKRPFTLAPSMVSFIHQHLFQDLDPAVYGPGSFKQDSLVKSENILNGDSVQYADPVMIEKSLAFLFDREYERDYGADMTDDALESFARFVAHVWQVHPFAEGNTRTVAVFTILYLNHLGYDVTNVPFEAHSEYFRNALVRANYRNAKAKILPDLSFLVRFLDNLINGSEHVLDSGELICQELFDDPSLRRNT